MEKESYQNFHKYLIGIILVSFGMIFGFSASYFFLFPKNDNENARPVRQSGYRFINPLLECEVENISQAKSLSGIKSDVQNLINEEVKQNSVSMISVYFRDLNNGPWFGVNEDEKFAPASLLKVPLAMAYFRKAENDPSIMDKQIDDDSDESQFVTQNIAPEKKLEAGKKYTVKELINRMLVYSDNDATQLLVKNIDMDALNKTYPDLGMDAPAVDGGDSNIMTVVSYASFFRILFNASYLDRGQSEEILRILSQTDYKDGIVAGVPEGVAVAHKFGERQINDGNDRTEQLHDCGIVYYPNHPYLLCLMSKGTDFKDMASSIQKVSKLIYDEVGRKYGEN